MGKPSRVRLVAADEQGIVRGARARKEGARRKRGEQKEGISFKPSVGAKPINQLCSPILLLPLSLFLPLPHLIPIP